MSRTRASAKKAGTWLETLVATYLNMHVDDRIERRRQGGANDRGDIGGVRIHGQRVVIECKNAARTDLAGWAAATEIERGNDDALAGVIVHKRQGKARAEDQWVTLTLGDFAAILTGSREHYESTKETS